jgi:stage V sporulation protein B
MKRNEQMIKNAAILFAAMAFTKIIGAVLKIPLGNILGGQGLGYFSAAYSVFSPVYALTAAAVPAVITKLVAQNIAAGNYRTVRKIKRVALRAALLMGFFGGVLILVLVAPMALMVVKTPGAVPAMLVIAPALMFCCVSAVYKGYYEGLSDMTPTAVSQIVEAVAKAGVGIILSDIILLRTGSLSLAAAAAVLGVSVSEFCGFGFLFIISRKRADGIAKEDLQASPEPQRILPLLIGIFREMIPITICALVMNLGGLVDLITVTSGLNAAVASDTAFFLNWLPGLKSSGMTTSEIGNFIYGSYTGIAQSLFAIIPSMTALVGKSALPAVTAAWSNNNKDQLRRRLNACFSGTFVLGMPLCLGLACMAEPLLSLLYSGKPEEVAVCIPVLTLLAAGGILLSLSGTLSNIFLAMGRSDLQMRLTLVGVAVKILLNLILIPIAQINILGAAVSTLACYAVMCVAGLILLMRMTGNLDLWSAFWRAGIPALCCAGTAFAVREALPEGISRVLGLLFAVMCGALVFVTMILFTQREYIKRIRKS